MKWLGGWQGHWRIKGPGPGLKVKVHIQIPVKFCLDSLFVNPFVIDYWKCDHGYKYKILLIVNLEKMAKSVTMRQQI